jgi:cytochrome c-type biogenesis protein CcmH/NrfG
MTLRVPLKAGRKYRCTARFVVLALLLLSPAAWPQGAASSSAGHAAAATLNRDSARCRAQADLSACYDAIRWDPGDPALLVALADALMHANRPADAIRNYRRAAALAPNMRGVAAKISAAEAKLPSGRAPGNRPVDRAALNGTPGKRYSNAAPEAQTH